MYKKRYKKKRTIRISQPQALSEMLDAFISSRAKTPEEAHFHELWKHWDMILGDELSPFIKPLGVRNKILLIGVEDNIKLQEARMEYDTLLDHANSFMKAFGHSTFFEKIEFSLFKGNRDLTQKTPVPQALRSKS